VEDYFDIGSFCRDVSTESTHARTWFNRGLIWCYSFAFEEAARCFARASDADDNCAMAYWGTAYALGPYYNKQWHKFDPVDLQKTLAACYAALQQASQNIEYASGVEQALINALSFRYQAAEPPADFGIWTDDYANSMRDVYRAFPDDLDVCTLFADAMMNRTPWALWDLRSGEPSPGADTLEIIEVLEKALQQVQRTGVDDHPGLLHLYIHALEMSPHPEKAMRAADRLRGLVPDAGHLRHMPTHIDAQCGNYYEVVVSNDAAIAADEKYVDQWGKVNFHALSRAHNFHFKLYGAMLLGQYQAAVDASNGMLNTIPEELLRVQSPPMADWLEGYVAMKVHAPVRFGRWHELIAEPMPHDSELYCASTAMLHYAKTLAHAVLGDIESAETEKQLFTEAVARVPETRMVFNNTCLDILRIAGEMANGEVEYRKGNFDGAFEHLRRAVQHADDLPYDEPWGWMQPARHALGALLLEQGRLVEAEAVYRADLGLNDTLIRACQHHGNVWSLHGFHECLRRQNKHAEADLIAPGLKLAMARADVPIEASCLCRLRRSAW